MLNIGIIGYGNVGKALHKLALNDNSFNVKAIFSRRKLNLEIYRDINEIDKYTNEIDIMLIAQGSAYDLYTLMSKLIGKYNTVDSYDNHSKLSQYKEMLHSVQMQNGKVSVTSVGWDPGILSIERAIMTAFIEDTPTTFWGKGISQGHSNALRTVNYVTDGIQLTVPQQSEIERKWNTPNISISHTKAHKRVCYVHTDKIKYQDDISNNIKSIPEYFEPYDTEVNFVTQSQLNTLKIQNLGHAGNVIANDGSTRSKFTIELQNNAMFTARIMLKYAKAIPTLINAKQFGALDCLDIPIKYLLSNKDML